MSLSEIRTLWSEGEKPLDVSYNPNDPPMEEPHISDSLRVAWQAALTKDTALVIRIWLGDETGAKMEMSTDQGATFQTLLLDDESTPIDTIGMTGGADFHGAKVGQADPVWVQFGPSFGITYVDDAIVFNDSNQPDIPVNAAQLWTIY